MRSLGINDSWINQKRDIESECFLEPPHQHDPEEVFRLAPKAAFLPENPPEAELMTILGHLDLLILG